MAESNLSKVLMKHFKSVGHATRIENLASSGMPDVSYCIDGVEGFIENKLRAAWPQDPGRIVTLPHYSAQQRLWHERRATAGGRVYVLLGIGTPLRDVLLFEGGWAAAHLGRVPKQELVLGAVYAGMGVGFRWESVLPKLLNCTNF